MPLETQLLAKDVVDALRRDSLTLACAESLTGGDVCARLVDVPGASDVLRGGILAYATPLKHTLLGVSEALLRAGGPVQAAVAEQMARGVARTCESDIGVATTGVAGPGDTPGAAAGTVFIALALVGADSRLGARPPIQSRELHLSGSRDQVRAGTVRAVYQMLLDTLSATG